MILDDSFDGTELHWCAGLFFFFFFFFFFFGGGGGGVGEANTINSD